MSSKLHTMIAFGPIPSRRLGYSLGINNIPPKSCTYDCLYCQVGRTNRSEYLRRAFYPVDDVINSVLDRIREVEENGERIDFLTFVPDGEPTLDINLGEALKQLKSLPYKLAVITNGSLLGLESVQKDLALADLVSIKVDSVNVNDWNKINRPNGKLHLPDVLAGVQDFAENYQGEIITETMLLAGINDDAWNLETIAGFLKKLNPVRAYIAIPTRPTSERWVTAPDAKILTLAHEIFSQHLKSVELLTGFSEEDFAISENPINELLNITAVHPMRRSEALKFLQKSGGEVDILDNLVEEEKLLSIDHQGEVFYLRKHDVQEN